MIFKERTTRRAGALARRWTEMYTNVQMSRRRPTTITMSEARASFAKLLTRAAEGEDVQVTRGGRPVAVLVSVEEYQRTRGDAAPVSQAFQEFMKALDRRVLRGVDPWRKVRERSPGRSFRW